MRPHPTTLLTALAALAGLAFAAVSTADFAAHLDRQVHGIQCSFLPGVGPDDASGASGCHVTMMSPYSSVLRAAVWGGIPISLPAMSVFAFLLFWTLALVIGRRQEDPRATGFLALATLLPVLASVGMGIVSFAELGAACKICIGIYASSALAFVGALLLFRRARALERGGAHVEVPPTNRAILETDATRPDLPTVAAGRRLGFGTLAAAFILGVAMVGTSALVYAASAPDFERFLGACGELRSTESASAVALSLGSRASGVDAIEVFDPLCPACRAFERRLEASGLDREMSRKLVLFPLDDACNWMIDRAIHPGACAISEAMLCADERSEDVLAWAFSEQEAIVEASTRDPKAAERMVTAKFPSLKGCIGSPAVKAKLNRSLRWAVTHELPILTPQLYVEGVRLCDEDGDLGLEYALSRMLEKAKKGTLRAEAK